MRKERLRKRLHSFQIQNATASGIRSTSYRCAAKDNHDRGSAISQQNQPAFLSQSYIQRFTANHEPTPPLIRSPSSVELMTTSEAMCAAPRGDLAWPRADSNAKLWRTRNALRMPRRQLKKRIFSDDQHDPNEHHATSSALGLSATEALERSRASRTPQQQTWS